MNSFVGFLSFFCFLTVTFGSCPNDSVQFRDSCYSFFSNSTQFPDAELACNGMNGHLASIHDGFTNAILTSESSKHFHDSTISDFWIGLNSLMTPGNWSWTDLTPYDFKEWGTTEPQNISMSCAALKIQNGIWATGDCFKPKAYVCETAFTTAPPLSTPSYPAYMNCSEGWIYFEPTHSCYGHDGYGLYYGNWTSGEQYCANQGAHLTSIHSYDEARFLTTVISFTSSVIWTGLISYDNEVSWRWSDKSETNYLPWASGFPNRNISSCAYLNQNQLYDDDCTDSWYIVCKKPAVL